MSLLTRPNFLILGADSTLSDLTQLSAFECCLVSLSRPLVRKIAGVPPQAVVGKETAQLRFAPYL